MNTVKKTDIAESAAGDRQPAIDQVYPHEAYYHADNGGRVLDVTKPPFNARGDGVTDDTQALIAALRFVRDNYEILQGDDYCFCGQRSNRNEVVYLPDGEYLVSDTVSQDWPALAMNILKGWDHCAYFRAASPEHERQLYESPARPPCAASTTWSRRRTSPAAGNACAATSLRKDRPCGSKRQPPKRASGSTGSRCGCRRRRSDRKPLQTQKNPGKAGKGET